MDYPARMVGAVKEVEDESLQYFAHRFEQFREKVDALIKKNRRIGKQRLFPDEGAAPERTGGQTRCRRRF